MKRALNGILLGGVILAAGVLGYRACHHETGGPIDPSNRAGVASLKPGETDERGGVSLAAATPQELAAAAAPAASPEVLLNAPLRESFSKSAGAVALERQMERPAKETSRVALSHRSERPVRKMAGRSKTGSKTTVKARRPNTVAAKHRPRRKTGSNILAARRKGTGVLTRRPYRLARRASRARRIVN